MTIWFGTSDRINLILGNIKNEFIDDLSNLKGFAKILQSGIIGKANSVMDKLALLDLKLKEQKLLTQEIDGIRQHPGNINSNLRMSGDRMMIWIKISQGMLVCIIIINCRLNELSLLWNRFRNFAYENL